MDYESIWRLLYHANVGIDQNTVRLTVQFLDQHIGSVSEEMRDYEIFSAAAIVGQSQIVTDVRGQTTKSGITLESVMRHIGKMSREEFLNVLSRQISKWREAPYWLTIKIDNLKISYRIFKKYRSVFDDLCRGNCLFSGVQQFNLMAIFWILYLYVKNENQQIDNAIQSISLLHCDFLFLFTEVVVQNLSQDITSTFQKQFPQSKMPNQDTYQQFRLLLVKKLNQIYNWRFVQSNIELQQLATDQNYSLRILDDISNRYDVFRATLQKNHIDQMSFLQLVKDVTPMTINRSRFCAKAITRRINFNSDSDKDSSPEEQPPSQTSYQKQKQKLPSNLSFKRVDPMSPFKPYGTLDCPTPVAGRSQNLGWINQILNKQTDKDIERFKIIFTRSSGCDYLQFQAQSIKKITETVKWFTPTCTDKPKRQMQLYRFFIHFILKIAQSHNETEQMNIFSTTNNFYSIMCLTTDIFNFAYQSIQAQYQRYCKIFGITLLEGHKPLNWFGKNQQTPKNIELYLYNLQKKMLIQQIWESKDGYNLISLPLDQKQKYHVKAAIRRLKRHVTERTRQLCDKMKVIQTQIIKVTNLMIHIIDNRCHLLKDHVIDQIIVCSIASVLSINKSMSERPLDQIFNLYKQLQHSYYSNINRHFDGDGNQIDLYEYYNLIFLPSIDYIVKNEENIANILCTPIRTQRKNLSDQGLESTPIHIKFNQGQGEKMIKIGSGGYRKKQSRPILRLANSLKNIAIKQKLPEEEEDKNESPRFGGVSVTMNRTFSFSDGKL